MVDLPALEPVAWIISAGVGRHQNSMPFWRLDAGAERMFDQRHLGDEVGHLDQVGMGVAAGDDDVLVGRLLFAQEFQHVVDGEVVVAQHDVEFVEQHQAVAIVADQFLGALPRRWWPPRYRGRGPAFPR